MAGSPQERIQAYEFIREFEMTRKFFCLFFLILFSGSVPAVSQNRILEAFKPVCDTLETRIQEKTSVKGDLGLRAVMKRGSTLDFYFTRSLGDFPWHDDTYGWFRTELRELFPEGYSGYGLGEIYSNRIRMSDLITNVPGNDGHPDRTPYRIKDRRQTTVPLVENPDMPEFHLGLSGRHIALWQSHGRYYEQKTRRWEWQRPCLFQTVEDLFTSGFVLPYLVPMLENAGCMVLLPRERDLQTAEIITDNDPHFIPDTLSDPLVRTFGTYAETGEWKDAGCGFADTLQVYTSDENPFRAGTARMAECIPPKQKSGKATAVWTPVIPERGEYAVYVSYKTLPNSTESAHYTVRHMGGESHFIVNQTMGGGTWIYLGTFEFGKGSEGKVLLDNVSPAGRNFSSGKAVTADAVKIGGGMGNIARKCKDDTLAVPELSGLPRFAEGARYWMQWAGADTSVYSQNRQANDYMDDFMSRGKWVQELSGGSAVNPKEKGRNIPVDMAFAFHSDAGVSPGDSIIGTLGIYTRLCENSSRFPDKSSRMTSRELTDLIQSQVVNDLRAGYDPLWSRRHIWDRSYSESRTTGVPTMLLEMMSHQNFSDMKHGLDPSFRFTVSRAVYKGILKYLSNRYGCEYAVQPLPVHSFAVSFSGKGGSPHAMLSWKETADTLEPTAAAKRYFLYTKLDDGAFDTGKEIKDLRVSKGRIITEVPIIPGHIYSFRIAAANSGGISFPSETLSIGLPEGYAKGNGRSAKDSAMLIVNNFDRVSCPAWFDTPQYAGFDNTLDSGVPYMKEFTYVGEMYQFRRSMPWTDDDNPGFGASFTDRAGSIIAGNTFNYPYIHGKAVMKAGYPFFSAGSDAFVSDSTLRESAWCADIICGKQVTTMIGRGAVRDRYAVFPQKMQDALRSFTSEGGNVLISGSNIGTDVWDSVFPVKCDSTFRANSMDFVQNVLGYRWICNYASRSARVSPVPEYLSGFNIGNLSGEISFANVPNSRIYCVETPDGLAPASDTAKAFLQYSDTRIPAGICYDAGAYKAVSIGFPIETVDSTEAIYEIISSSLKYFTL